MGSRTRVEHHETTPVTLPQAKTLRQTAVYDADVIGVQNPQYMIVHPELGESPIIHLHRWYRVIPCTREVLPVTILLADGG